MFDCIIIGAGFAGSVLAERLANKKNKKILIIEKRNHIGGNCYDFRNEIGVLIHKYGPHIFHTNSKYVWDYLSNFTDWRPYQHRVLVYIDGNKVPLPINLNSIKLLFPQDLSEKIISKLLQKYPYGSKVPILTLLKSNDSTLKFFAEFIYKKVFLNYTFKQWGKKPEELKDFVTARVPIIINRDNRYFQDKYQGLPLQGYTELFKKLLKNRNINILLNTDFKEILKFDPNSRKFYFLGLPFKGIVIYTAPIDELFDYQFGVLPYRSVNLVFRKYNMEFFQEVATVNYPNNYDFTRITEFKHFYINDTFEKIKGTTVLYEYPTKYHPTKNVPYYPFFTKEAEENYLKYKELASKVDNLILIGRLAEYRYYNMDDIVLRALQVFDEFFS